MKLWLITPDRHLGYDSYTAAVAAAPTAGAARNTHPLGLVGRWDSSTWVDSPDRVKAEEIGTAKRGTKAGTVLAAFHAG